jgi:ankyrin repeat protein
MSLLLKAGASMKTRDYVSEGCEVSTDMWDIELSQTEWSVLHVACYHGNPESVSLLLEAGADSKARAIVSHIRSFEVC